LSEANGGNNGTPIVSNVIWSFKIGDNGDLTEKQVFFDFATLGTEMEDIDGMRTDTDGNLWVSRNGAGRVVKLSPEGEFLEAFTTAITFQTNLDFGGPDGKTLYIVGRCNGNSTAPYWGQGPGCMEKLETTGAPGTSWAYLHRAAIDDQFDRHHKTIVAQPNLFILPSTKQTCLEHCAARADCQGVDYGFGKCYGKGMPMTTDTIEVAPNFFHFEKRV